MGDQTYLENCVSSILRYTTNIDYEILINAYKYTDSNYWRIIETFGQDSRINIIRTDGIKGYSENHNENLKRANGEIYCILNDDTYIRSNVFKICYDYIINNNQIGALCPILLNWDGSFQLGYRKRITPLRFIIGECKLDKLSPLLQTVFDKKRFYFLFKDRKVIELHEGTGACFFVKRRVLKSGLLDTQYFLSPDDINWSHKILKQGFKIVLLTDAKVYHKGHHTLNRYFPASMPSAVQGVFDLFKKEGFKYLSIYRSLEIVICFQLFLYNWLMYKLFKKERFYLLYKARLNTVKTLLHKFNNSKDVFEKFLN